MEVSKVIKNCQAAMFPQSAFEFAACGQFDSVAEAVELVVASPKPHKTLAKLAHHGILGDDLGFVSEVITKFSER